VSPQLALLALALAAAGGRGSAPPAEIPFHRELLEDGTELVLLPVPGAALTSLRHVVRVGSGFDPPGKDGLAHLLEHVVAMARTGDGSLLEDVQAAGGFMNAYTSVDATIYALDAPSRAFPGLAARLVSAITSPRLDAGEIEREQDVILSERGRRGGAIGLAEGALFKAPASILGTATTRDGITRADLADFFVARYVTPATTVVLAGDLTLEQARALLDGAFHLPPALPGERAASRPEAPTVPLDEQLRASIQGVVFGYRIDEADRPLCDAVAELVGARLLRSVYVNRPLAAHVDVACHTLRGHLFLLAVAYSRALEATELPAEVEAAFRTAVDQPMTAAELAVLGRRRSRQRAALRDSPPALAAAAAELAALPRQAEPTRVENLAPPAADARTLQAFARRALDPAQRVRIVLSPLKRSAP
jgi:predicted Zn-dependent peptidase